MLLADIHSIFQNSRAERLLTRDLLAALAALPDRPWKGVIQSDRQAYRWLAGQLEPLGIHSRTFRISGTCAKG